MQGKPEEEYDACPECGSENLGVVGNGPYRKFRCKERGCYWFHKGE